MRVRIFPRHPAYAIAAAIVLAGSGCATRRDGVSFSKSDPLRLAKAELRAARSPDERLALASAVHAADLAWGELQGAGDMERLPARRRAALDIYNTACGAAATACLRMEKPVPASVRDRAGDAYAVSADLSRVADLTKYAELASVKPAARVSRKGCRERVMEKGLGAPLVARWHPRNRPEWRRFLPRDGCLAPLTAVVEFPGKKSRDGARTARVAFLDTSVETSVRLDRADWKLAADFTAPIADRVNEVNELWMGVLGVLRADRFDARLQMLDPPRDGRIPVVLVHGLLSHPAMWSDVVNELRADPEIRRRCQFWTFWYPSGWPISYSALQLREELAAARGTFGPEPGMVLIGHSMGGILARMQAVEPGRVLWDTYFGKNADRMLKKVPPGHLFRKVAFFHANPDIGREIYICVPHRGSSMADWSLTHWVAGWIRLPGTLVTTIRSLPGVVTDIRNTTSIVRLSPGNPLFAGLEKVPILVPHHSIIGNRGKKGSLAASSDGVVAYWSSHLDSAKSEKIVPGNHGSYNNPEAVAEMRRILREHLRRRL